MSKTPPPFPEPDASPFGGAGPGARSEERSAATGRLRDPGGPGAALLAWLVLLSVVGAIVYLHSFAPVPPPPPGQSSDADVPADVISVLMGRYVVGASAISPAGSTALVSQLDTSLPDSPASRIRVAIAEGELVGPERAVERLEQVLRDAEGHDSDAEPPTSDAASAHDGDAAGEPAPDALSADLRDDIALLREIYSGVDVPRDPADHAGFVERHGWFARLGLSYGLPDSAPVRAEALAAALRTATVFLIGALGAMALVVAGLCVSIVAVVMAVRGKLRAAYRPPAPGGSVFLETIALFFAGLLAVQFIAMGIQTSTGLDLSYALIWLLPPIAFWPLLRGMPFRTMRYAMGWHSGRGVLREIGAGVMGYLAGLPIFGVGIVLTLILGWVQGVLSHDSGGGPPTHPIFEEMGKGGLPTLLLLLSLASVWAPLTEESIFRGAFFHHLRGRAPALVAALMTGFIFAVVHPQGFIAVPALMSLGVIFALMREWRGSLIAPMTAHALHNGTLVTLVTLALS